MNLKYIYLVEPGEERGCSANSFVIHSLTHWSFGKISLRHRHALMVKDGAFSHKITILKFSGDSKSWRATKLYYCFNTYRNFAEWVDFAFWLSFSGGGSAINRATPSSWVYIYLYRATQSRAFQENLQNNFTTKLKWPVFKKKNKTKDICAHLLQLTKTRTLSPGLEKNNALKCWSGI